MKKSQFVKLWEQVPPDYYQKGVKENVLQRLWHHKKTETFKDLLSNKSFKKILDLGCASGMMTNRISKIFPESKITGIDIYPSAIEYAKGRYPNIRFIVGNAHKLPFEDSSFDLIVCYETIEHVVDPRKTLEEIKRVTKKDGIAIVAMDSGNILFRTVWWVWERTKGKVWQGAHLHPFHHSELEKLIRKTGFRIINKRSSHLGMEVSFVLKKRIKHSI